MDSLALQFDKIQTEIEVLADSDDESIHDERMQFDDRHFALLAQATTLLNAAGRRPVARSRRRRRDVTPRPTPGFRETA